MVKAPHPEGVRVQESEKLFEMMKAKVTDYQEAGFEELVMGDFNGHIGLGAEQSPNRDGRKLLDLVGMCNLRMSFDTSTVEAKMNKFLQKMDTIDISNCSNE